MSRRLFHAIPTPSTFPMVGERLITGPVGKAAAFGGAVNIPFNSRLVGSGFIVNGMDGL